MASKRPVVFLFVGVINTLIDFAIYTILSSFILKGPENIALVGIISGTIALFFAFLMHSLITWKETPITKKTLVKFVAFTGFGMWVLRPILLALFIKLSGLYSFVYTITNKLSLPFSYDFVANTGSFGLMIVIVLVYNYTLYERVVFKKTSSHTEPETH